MNISKGVKLWKEEGISKYYPLWFTINEFKQVCIRDSALSGFIELYLVRRESERLFRYY